MKPKPMKMLIFSPKTLQVTVKKRVDFEKWPYASIKIGLNGESNYPLNWGK